MTTREELELILKLIGKYNLPLSPILEYAVKEKMEEYAEEEKQLATSFDSEETDEYNVEFLSEELSSEDETEEDSEENSLLDEIEIEHVYLDSKGNIIKKEKAPYGYTDKDMSIESNKDNLWSNQEAELQKKVHKKKTSRYIIRVVCPDGTIYESNRVWETLVDVVKYAGPEEVRRLNIRCLGDNIVSNRLNENPIYRDAQKGVGGGLYVSTYSSTDTKYKQIVLINLHCGLGLKIEKVYIENYNEEHEQKYRNRRRKRIHTYEEDVQDVFSMIGRYIRVLPSQFVGKVIDVKKYTMGNTKFAVKNYGGEILMADTNPLLYEILTPSQAIRLMKKASKS